MPLMATTDITSAANMPSGSTELAATPPPSSSPHAQASLDTLSNEILFLVAECLLGDAQARFDSKLSSKQTRRLFDSLHPPPPPPFPPLGHLASPFPWQVPERGLSFRPPPSGLQSGLQLSASHSFQSGLNALTSLALASRRFRSIAQPVLFRAPVLSIGSSGRWDDKSPIYLFARVLLQQPEVSKWTTSLRIDLPETWGGSMEATTSDLSDERYRVVLSIVNIIDAIDWMDPQPKKGWKWQLQRLRPLPFCALILCLLPNLRQLNLSFTRGGYDNPFSSLFWMTDVQNMSDAELHRALSSLAKCPGLANLRHINMSSWVESLQSPLSDLVSLNSLDMTSANTFEEANYYNMLARIKHLRIRCDVVDLPRAGWDDDTDLLSMLPALGEKSGFENFLARLKTMFSLLIKLETLDIYTVQESHHATGSHRNSVTASGKYSRLVEQCADTADTLRTLKLPRGWWTLPSHESLDLTHQAQDFPPDSTRPLDNVQPGAYTGSITDLRPFTRLEKLVTHSTGIIAKGAQDTEVADPTQTLPPSIKFITVYGAHDGLWSWIGDILERRATHFSHLQSITLLCEEQIHSALTLSRLAELKQSHATLWEMICESTVVLQGDL